MKIRAQKSTFAVDVIKMVTAPLFTQILGVILMPVVTRLYAPDAYGVYQLFGSIQMIICVFATMGYNNAIVLPQRDEMASNLLFVSAASTILISILTVPFILFGSGLLLRWLRAPELGIYLWILPISVLTYGIQISFLAWNVRNKRFGRIAISKISFSVANKSVLIGAGFSGFATSGSLLAGDILSSITMSGVLGGKIWQESGSLFKKNVRLYNIVQVIKSYRKFPMYNLWTDIVNRLASLITVFLFSFYFSNSVIGYYGLGIAVLSMPMTFIGSAIIEVFYQKVAASDHERAKGLLIETLFKYMTLISMLLFLLITVIGDNVFSFVFGVKWSEAGVYSQILSFNIFINFIMSPALILANVLEKQEVSLIVNILTAIMSCISITIGGLYNNIYWALGMFSLLNGLTSFGAGLLMINYLGLPISRIFRILLKCFVACVPIIIVVASAKWYLGASAMSLMIISAIGSTIYYGKLLKEDKLLQSIVIMVFRKVKS